MGELLALVVSYSAIVDWDEKYGLNIREPGLVTEFGCSVMML